ncbi:hypothetical protein U1Q18_040940, partial [Sarracenia purpurea var. burkii]
MGSVVGTTIDLNIVENANGVQLVDYRSSSPDISEEGIVECGQSWRTDFDID